jgi:hypothetical protein
VLALVAHPEVLQLVAWRPPASVGRAIFAASVFVLAGSIATAATTAIRRWSTATTTPAAVAVYFVAVAFPLPLVVTRSPYAAIGGLTLAHGLQYLLLVGQVVVGPSGHRQPRAREARVVAILALILLAAGTLATASHLHDNRQLAARAAFGGYLGLVMTHFVVDAGLWRLRDEFPRRWLTGRVPQLLGISG